MTAKKYWISILVVSGIAAVALSVDTSGAEDMHSVRHELGQHSLAGLQGVHVVLHYEDPEAKKQGRVDPSLQAGVELQLRESGLKILTSKEMTQKSGSPYLYIGIDDGPTAASVAVRLIQRVTLQRDAAITCHATTWDRTFLVSGTEKNLKRMIRKHIRRVVDQFGSDYLKANPQVLPLITGTVRHLGFEGGFYGIEADNGQKYDPTNLPKEFRQDGLRVRFQVKERKRMAGIHMWGKIVEIIKIERL